METLYERHGVSPPGVSLAQNKLHQLAAAVPRDKGARRGRGNRNGGILTNQREFSQAARRARRRDALKWVGRMANLLMRGRSFVIKNCYRL
jgi:hypothetical protein